MILFEKMSSTNEQRANTCDTTGTDHTAFVAGISARKHIDLTSLNAEPPAEEIIILKSAKSKQPLDYLIWSSLLVISGMLILCFVVVIILIAAFKNM